MVDIMLDRPGIDDMAGQNTVNNYVTTLVMAVKTTMQMYKGQSSYFLGFQQANCTVSGIS